MKKFNLPLTTAISAAMLAAAGCGSDREWQIDKNTRVGTDASGNRVPDDQCRNQTPDGYRWYYISRGGNVPTYNGPISGGSYQPAASPDSYASAPADAPVGAHPGPWGASLSVTGVNGTVIRTERFRYTYLLRAGLALK